MKLLRERRKNLTHEPFDGDEKLVGKCDEIKALKSELKSVERALDRLIATPQARPLLMLESHLGYTKSATLSIWLTRHRRLH